MFTPDFFSAQGSMGGHQQLPQHYASGCGGGGVSSGSPSTNFANNLRALASLESQQNFQQTPLNVAQQFGFGGNGGHSGGYGNGSRHSDQQQSGAAANSQYHQVWSLTLFYFVDFSQSGIGVTKCVFNKCTIKVRVSCC